MDSTTDNRTVSSDNQQARAAPRLCARGCGFFGTAEKRGLCSKCYEDYIKEEKTAESEAISMGKGRVSVLPADQSKIKVPQEVEIGNLVDALNSATITEVENTYKASDSAAPFGRNRCGLCKKKVGLLPYTCRCGGAFCGMHRYPEEHSCEFDFKKAGQSAIQKENPVCVADKMKDRI